MLMFPPPIQIRIAIEFLEYEGHIYSTVDDEHFKLTGEGPWAQGRLCGMTMTQTKVYSAIKKCPSDNQTGLSVRDIQSTTSMPMNDVSIWRQFQIWIAIEFLSNEGHIYSTVDEEHFKFTEPEYC
eukprot:sb/3475676/